MAVRVKARGKRGRRRSSGRVATGSAIITGFRDFCLRIGGEPGVSGDTVTCRLGDRLRVSFRVRLGPGWAYDVVRIAALRPSVSFKFKARALEFTAQADARGQIRRVVLRTHYPRKTPHEPIDVHVWTDQIILSYSPSEDLVTIGVS